MAGQGARRGEVDLLSPAGLIGAALGALVGWLDHRVVGGIVERKLRETDTSSTPAEKADYERRIRWFRRIFLLAAVGFFTAVGYTLGRVIGG